ncbi:MAG: hypothetical protein HY327_11050 [Chloroflexi bacterium]|nr:hypothetical protein [Chloroflexota bacterium]
MGSHGLMPATRTALIIIATFKDDWRKLSLSAQNEFVERIGATAQAAGILPVSGYRLSSAPGAFLQVWEGADRATVDRAVEALQGIGYARYIEARFLIGERDL